MQKRQPSPFCTNLQTVSMFHTEDYFTCRGNLSGDYKLGEGKGLGGIF